MKIASSVILIIYASIMLLPLGKRNISPSTKLFLLGCELSVLVHVFLYFYGHPIIYTLLLCVGSFQIFSLIQGIKQGKIHWQHQLIRFLIHLIIVILFIL